MAGKGQVAKAVPKWVQALEWAGWAGSKLSDQGNPTIPRAWAEDGAGAPQAEASDPTRAGSMQPSKCKCGGADRQRDRDISGR